MRGSRPKRERRPLPPGFGVIWTTVALDLIGFGILFPVLARYARDTGASPATAGLLVASFSIAQVVFSPITGRLSDRFGRKPIIILSLTGTAVGSLLTGLAGSLWLLFLAASHRRRQRRERVRRPSGGDRRCARERTCPAVGIARCRVRRGVRARTCHRWHRRARQPPTPVLHRRCHRRAQRARRRPPAARDPSANSIGARTRARTCCRSCRRGTSEQCSRPTGCERRSQVAARHLRLAGRFQRLRGDVLAPHRGSLRPVGERDVRRVLPDRYGPGVRAGRPHPSSRRSAR